MSATTLHLLTERDYAKMTFICRHWMMRRAVPLAEDLLEIVVVNNKQEQKWEKPSPGYLKLNTDADAEVNPHTNRMSYGWVLRDDVGQFVAASCIPKEAEAMATRETLGDRTSLSTDPIMKFLPCLLESSSFYHNK
nr:uncharacterized protein LOC109191080 [Ipomoea trifida]